MKNILNKIAFLIVGLLTIIACQDDYSLGEIETPSNITVTQTIVGQDTDNPDGDGTGEVIFNITADNAFQYKLIVNGSEEIDAGNGEDVSHLFSETGTATYAMQAVAFGAGGVSDTLDFETTVLVTYQAPADLIEKLCGDSSKTWRIKYEADGHFGLGPVLGDVPCAWYGAGAYDKEDTGMYDDTFTFNTDGTYYHETNGTIFGRITLVDELGSSGGTIDGADVYNVPYDSYTATWSLSAPNDVETVSLSGKGFIGYYTGGNHKYRIFNRSVDNELTLSTTDGNGEFEWWFVLTTEPAP